MRLFIFWMRAAQVVLGELDECKKEKKKAGQTRRIINPSNIQKVGLNNQKILKGI